METEFELETVEVGPYSFEITTVAHLPIELLMFNHAKGVEISGQKVWCGSLSVAQYFLNNKHLVVDHVVVELGAGTGILGMICEKLGCQQVFLTDNDPQSLLHMQEDCPRNGIVHANIVSLDWFNPDINSLQLQPLLESSKLIVVAGDVLYKHALIAPFFSTVCQLLRLQPESCMYLCHVPRAGVEQNNVITAAKEHGLHIEAITASSSFDTSSSTDGTSTDATTSMQAALKEDSLREYCPEEDISRSQLYRIQLQL